MTDTPTPPKGAVALSNEDRMKEAAFADLREIGRSEGKGKTARLRAAEYVAQKAKENLLDETDNQRIWEEITIGAGEEMVDVGGIDLRDTQQFKQRASDIKHFIVLGRNSNLDGPEVLRQAIKRMRHLRESKVVKSGRVWELLLAFARSQNNSPSKALSEKQIDKTMADKASGATKRNIAEKLWALRESLLKINEGNDYPLVYDACNSIEEQVKKLGGTKKQKKAAKETKLQAAREARKTKPKTDKKRSDSDQPVSRSPVAKP